MNWNIARWLNRGARLTLVGVLSLLGFAVVHLVLGGSPALAAPLAAPNDPPTISAIAGQTTPEDVTLGPITFYVSDTETAANALTVTTDPANPALFGTIAQTNSGVTRTLTITPAANAAGSSVVTVTVSDGISTTDEIFLLTVTAVNDVPTISAISDQTIAEDGATSAIGFTVGDVETTAASLQVTATTSNAGLAPLSSIVFGGAGVNRNVTVTPIANANGVAVITVQVSDGTATTNEPFTLTVTAANDAPTVSAIGDQTIVEDSATSALAFTVDDLETAAASLQVTATTNNAGLVPLSGIVFGGSGANRTVTVTPSPNASGSALITVQVSDGTTTTTEPFMVNVTAVNDAPTVSAIADQFIAEDFPTSALAFTVGDLETALGSLQITATTGNAAVVPLSGIVFGGSGANRTVTVTPAPNANGAALITVQVSDGTATATEPFTLNITPTNDVPTISNITGQSTNEDTATGAIAFTVSDVETAPGSLIYSLSAANPALIGSFVFGGSGSARMLVITPAANANGTSVVTVTVSDGAASVSDNFVLTVNAVNDAPVFGVVNDVVVNEDSAPTFNFTISDVDTAIGNVIVTDDNSNNPALVSNVAVSGNTGTRTVNISLVANATGTAQITLIASDQVGGFSSKTFTLTVNGVNDAPTITAIGNQSTNEDTALGPINFMVSDIDSASLTVSASSANQTVVANSGLVVSPATGGNGGRSLTITPVANANGGPTQITVVVNDGQTTAQTVFLLTVNPVNDPPTINAIASQSTNEDTPLNVTVTFSDVDGDALTPSAVAGNATLMPNANLVFSGGGNSRTLTMTPAPDMNGSTLITVTVVDPSGTPALTSFLLTVNPVNDAPTIDNLVQQSGQEDTPFNFSPVVVNDVDSPVNGIVLTATSSNQSLVQNGNISFGGNGNNRSISMTPQPDQSGLVVVSIFASDGQATATRLFNVEFNLSNDAPTISAIANQSTNEDTATGAIAFTVADMDDSASSLNIVSSSSNPTLVPAGNIVPGGSGANRSVTITPAPNQFGTVVISVTVRDAGGLTASSRFTLTVNGVNDAPTISSVGTQFVQESGNSGPIPFTIGDLETTASALVVTVVSSNQSVIQNSGLVLGGSGANRTLTITPVQFQNGSATVTLTVRDPENLSATTQFLVTVDEVNDPPTITQISDVDIPEDSVMGPISFQINDVETPPSQLSPTVTSSNLVLVPLSSIKILGSGINRTITITPLTDNAGVSDITLTLVDGVITTNETFRLTVNSVNDAPKISPISPLSMTEDTLTTTTFTVNDVDNSPASLQVSAVSSNPTLVPVANISFGGGGINRNVTIVPALNQTGTTTVTVTVSDGGSTDNTSFLVTVNAVNDVPTISAIADQVTNEDVATPPIGFNVNDVETPASSLQVTATSSNPALVPLSGIALSGNGSERLVTLTPLPDQSGNTTISLIVTDGNGATTTRDFLLVVNPVNDAPVISAIRGKTILQSTFVTIPVALGDVDNPPGQLQLTAEIASSNPNLIPNSPSNFYFTGNTLSRLLTIVPTPGEIGSATVTVTVTDGSATSRTVFPVVVTPFNNAPSISAIANQVINEDTMMGPVEFSVADVELPPGDLEVLGVASNGTLIPQNHILISDFGGPTRTVVITPEKDQWGSATITLSVNDGLSSDSKAFNLTVNSVDDPPLVSSVQTKTNSSVLLAGVASKPMTFTVGDPDTPLGNLKITILSSNAGIVAPSDVTINGTGITRTLVVKPRAGKSGKVTITVQVSDGTTSVSTSFDITVGVRVNLPLLHRNFAICDPTQTDCSEPNNLLTTAFGPININTLYTGTVNGTSDRYDHYTITLEAEVSYTFKIDFPVGDLDLYLYGSAFASPPLAQSAKSGRPEQFEYRPRVTAVYYILVYGFEGGTATNRRYTLQVRQTSSRTQRSAEGTEVDSSVEELPQDSSPESPPAEGPEEPRPDPQLSNPGLE